MTNDKDEGTSETEQAVTATTQTVTVPLHLQTPAPMNLGGFQIGGGDTPLTLAITAQAMWHSTVNTDLTWDTDKVRQGATVAVGRHIQSITGTMGVLWSLSGTVDLGDVFGKHAFGPFPIAPPDEVTCVPDFTPQATGDTGGTGGVPHGFSPCGTAGDSGGCFGIVGDDGTAAGAGGDTNTALTDHGSFATTSDVLTSPGSDAGTAPDGVLNQTQLGSLGGQFLAQAAEVDVALPSFTCTAEGTRTLWKTEGVPNSPYLKLRMRVTFKIVQQKATTTSQFLIDDVQVAQNNIDLTPASASESQAMPCNKPAGSDVQYALGTVDWRPASALAT